MTDDEAKN